MAVARSRWVRGRNGALVALGETEKQTDAWSQLGKETVILQADDLIIFRLCLSMRLDESKEPFEPRRLRDSTFRLSLKHCRARCARV